MITCGLLARFHTVERLQLGGGSNGRTGKLAPRRRKDAGNEAPFERFKHPSNLQTEIQGVQGSRRAQASGQQTCSPLRRGQWRRRRGRR